MKIIHGVLIGTIVLTIGSYRGVTQQAGGSSLERLTPPQPLPSQYSTELILTDPNTHTAISPDGDQSKVAHLNTAEKIQQRALSVLAITHPDEFAQLHPKTQQQLQYEAEAAFAILFPDANYKRVRAKMSPQQLEEERLAALAMTNPQLYVQEMQRRRAASSSAQP